MIVQLPRFVAREKPYWAELEALLDRMERDMAWRPDLATVRRFHYLYQRVSADLGQLSSFASEQEIRHYLETLVARAYSEVHETRMRGFGVRFANWIMRTAPATFRRHIRAFAFATAVMAAGGFFGAGAVLLDAEAKEILLPFGHLMGSPSDRVAEEERSPNTMPERYGTTFAAYLMTHNTKISIMTLACGMTYGVLTLVILFYNGAILGAVALDYIRSGETDFLLGWLLPHGSIEIPAILVAGQASFVLAGALIGWGRRISLRARLREIAPDLVTLIFTCGLMLVWAGLVESFFSQYHEPVLPYAFKITVGLVELTALGFYLLRQPRTR